MKNVLWISRHEMTKEQHSDLERIVGEPIKVETYADTVRDIATLRPMICRSQVIAAVLPLELLFLLVGEARDKPVLVAKSKRSPTGKMLTLADGRSEQEFAFVHDGWDEVVRLELETRRL